MSVHPFQDRLFICGYDERAAYQLRRITHMVSVANPGAADSKPTWFEGAHLQLWFGDVVSEADARQCKTLAPNNEDIRRAVEFFRVAWGATDSIVLVTCDYGASRSPALAYLFIADQFGPGRASEAFELMSEIRPHAVPNGLVVRLGDTFLKRDGELLQPLKEFHSKLNAQLFE